MESLIGFAIAIAVLAVIIWIGCLPIAVARNKGSLNAFTIGFLTVIGWFFPPLWFAALFWAIMEQQPQKA